jgi:hypothetical protein
LDDAQFSAVVVPTAEDMVRRSQAEDSLSRQLFAGATVRDPERGIITFTENDYEAYREYVREHSKLRGLPPGQKGRRLELPILRISFFTRRILIEPAASKTVHIADGSLYFCDSGDPLNNRLASAKIMWRGRFVTNQTAQDIQSALSISPLPQEYEVFVPYTNWDRRSWRAGMETATLLPAPGDLCLALVELGYPLPSTTGRPLRIEKAAVAAALGPLPREISATQADEP